MNDDRYNNARSTRSGWFSETHGGLMKIQALHTAHLCNIINKLRRSTHEDKDYFRFSGQQMNQTLGAPVHNWLYERCISYPMLHQEAIRRRVWNLSEPLRPKVDNERSTLHDNEANRVGSYGVGDGRTRPVTKLELDELEKRTRTNHDRLSQAVAESVVECAKDSAKIRNLFARVTQLEHKVGILGVYMTTDRLRDVSVDDENFELKAEKVKGKTPRPKTVKRKR